ncbi:MAG: endonuclease/exonuclease/phosphatase family protein, partial [Planctomycetota bacterium]
ESRTVEENPHAPSRTMHEPSTEVIPADVSCTEAAAPGRSAPRVRPLDRRRRWPWAVALAAGAFFLVGETPRLPVPQGDGALGWAYGAAEVAAQLRLPSAAAIFVVAAALALFHRRAALITALVACTCALPALPVLARTAPTAASAPRLEVVSVNLLHPNVERDAVFDAILAEDPDVVALCEVSSEWRVAALDRLRQRYPHVVEGLDRDAWSPDAWGQMILARHPLEDARAEPLFEGASRQRPVLSARMRWGRRSVTVVAVHPQRPGRPWRFRARRAQLDATAAAARRPGADARLVCGDLNTTEGSPWFARLLEDGGLVDSRRGHGWQPSWFLTPSFLPKSLRPGLPLDHVLSSPELVCVERERFFVPGSDHRGVRATLAWAGPAPEGR